MEPKGPLLPGQRLRFACFPQTGQAKSFFIVKCELQTVRVRTLSTYRKLEAPPFLVMSNLLVLHSLLPSFLAAGTNPASDEQALAAVAKQQVIMVSHA